MRTRIDTRNYERHERSYGPDLTESRNSSRYKIYQRMMGCTFGLEDPVLAMFTVALLNAMGRKGCVDRTTEVVSKLAIGESGTARTPKRKFFLGQRDHVMGRVLYTRWTLQQPFLHSKRSS